MDDATIRRPGQTWALGLLRGAALLTIAASVLLGIGITTPLRVGATTAGAAFPNSAVADVALTYYHPPAASTLTQGPDWGGNACVVAHLAYNQNGQCIIFVHCVLYMASNHQVAVNQGVGIYYDRYLNNGGQLVSSPAAVKGDIIQIYDPNNHDNGTNVHTAIIIQNLGNDTFKVVDSNWGRTEQVNVHTLSPYQLAKSWGRSVAIWRFGYVDGAQSAPASPATLTGNVANLYRDVLQRTGSQSDIAGWVASIQKGTSITQAAQGFLYSNEYHTQEVNADYVQMLHRPADNGGLSASVNSLNSGARNEDVLLTMAISAEFWTNQAGQTNQGFVTALYADVLHRTPSSADVSLWVQNIANGETLTAVAQAFLSSSEYRTDLVNAWYLRYLNRSADTGGLNFGVNALNAGARDDDVVVRMVTSPEYVAK